MKIHDNGFEMKDGEHWWVGYLHSWNSDNVKVVLAKAIGDRPYQQLSVPGSDYPSTVWVLKRCNEYPETVIVRDADGEKRIVTPIYAKRMGLVEQNAPVESIQGPGYVSNPPTGGQTTQGAACSAIPAGGSTADG